MRRLATIIIIGFGLGSTTDAQTALQPFDENVHHWLDRIDVLYGNPHQVHFALKQISRIEIVQSLIKTDSLESVISPGDRENIQWLADQNNHWIPDILPTHLEYTDSSKTFYSYEKSIGGGSLKTSRSKRPFLKHFYKTPAHFFEVEKKDFFLRVNPLLRFTISNVNDDGKLLFENQRGISIQGGIDEKIYFHTAILESQARYADYVNDFRRKFNAVPGAGLVKRYQSKIFDFDNGVDYLLANAYLGVNVSRHVNLELGHGRHFLGNGLRSLFLSDFSTDYFYLKLNTRIWKFQYQNIFGELTTPKRIGTSDQLLPKRYFAAHYLSLNILSNLNVGLFETVVFARENQFELQYLNPVVLYRTVEGAIGSPDNVLLGLDIKWNLFRRASLYSQIILDEFKIGEITAGNGWWANKYGLQIGLKYFNIFGIDQLDGQVEYNAVRPYTFSHNTGVANYSQYNQGLAHPLGANFREILFQIRYQPTQKWSIIARVMRMQTGEDQDSLNWGSNILLPNNTHPSDFGNEIGQGVSADINILGLDVSYQLRQGFYLDFFYQMRNKESEDQNRDNKTTYIGGGVRWNLGRRWLEF